MVVLHETKTRNEYALQPPWNLSVSGKHFYSKSNFKIHFYLATRSTSGILFFSMISRSVIVIGRNNVFMCGINVLISLKCAIFCCSNILSVMELFKTSIPAYLAKQVCSVFYPLEVAAVALQYHFDFDRILRQQLLPPSRPMLLLHFLMMALPYAHRPL